MLIPEHLELWQRGEVASLLLVVLVLLRSGVPPWMPIFGVFWPSSSPLLLASTCLELSIP